MAPAWNSGSQWHRWDPHIHAPGTLHSDQFKGDWEGYLAAIQTASPTVEALGITDYCVLSSYQKFVEYWKAGRVSNVKFAFPNVELRLAVGTKAGKGINVHLLFSPDDGDHVAHIERLLAKLRFNYKGTDYPCAPNWLIKLGQAVDPTIVDEHSAMAKGAEQFKVDWDPLRELVSTDAWAQQNCLIAISASEGDGVSGLKDADSFQALREELKASPHIIFSGKDSDREFWLGRKPGFARSYLEREYGGLKPCLHGCDAHRLDRVLRPDLDRFCWIRSELSFMGLKQAVLDPESRALVGPNPPSQAARTETIASVRVTDASWLGQEEIELNDGLVAIIGPKGSGKTALADIIAHGAGVRIEDEASFLAHAEEHLDRSAVVLGWADGSKSDPRHLIAFREDSDGEPQVRYLSQQFVDRLCSADTLGEELVREIEGVVFQAVAPEDRLGATSFAELREVELEHVLGARRAHAEAIEHASMTVISEEAKRAATKQRQSQLESARQALSKKEKESDGLLPKAKKAEVERLAMVQNALDGRVQDINREKRRAKKIEDLTEECDRLTASTRTAFADLESRYGMCGLKDAEWAPLRPSFAASAGDVLGAAKRRAIEAAMALEKGLPGKARIEKDVQTWSVTELSALKDQLTKAIGVEQDRAKAHAELSKKIANERQAIAKLEREIHELRGADERIRTARDSRRQAYGKVFDTFAEEEATLKRLYAPLSARLAAGSSLESRLSFYVRRELDVRRWAEDGERLLDLRKGPLRHGRLREVAAESLTSAWAKGGSSEVQAAMDGFLQQHWDALKESKVTDATQHDLAQWLLSTDHIALTYGIKYDGVDVSKLSPGVRGIVLLMLYLGVDQWDTRPLIVDQPEENLDPQSVYEELVRYFRTARRRRQVILVTHNPNLVVNADADQVIVASSSREEAMGLPRISYSSGGLEEKATRANVCRILEGGERAFLERERRYALPRNPRTNPAT